jgi:hypothetical protein
MKNFAYCGSFGVRASAPRGLIPSPASERHEIGDAVEGVPTGLAAVGFCQRHNQFHPRARHPVDSLTKDTGGSE